jgi:DnaA family protein
MTTGGQQIPLPIQREDFATWQNWLSRLETEPMEQWLSIGQPLSQSAYLWGGSHVGKSHVLQACCHMAGHDARYLPLADLSRFPPEQVLTDAHLASLVAIDELDCIETHQAWQEPLFTLFNRCVESGAQLLVAANKAPAQLSALLPDLRSRLTSLTIFQLPHFSEEHIAALLRLRAEAAGITLSNEVLQYCAMRLPRDARKVVHFMEQLDRLSLAQSRPVTIPLIRESDLLSRDGD